MKKQLLAGLVAAGVAAWQTLVPITAQATVSSFQYKPTTLTMAGKMTLQADHVVATDPWSGQETSWVPIYYLQQALQSAGVGNAWESADTLNVTSTPVWWEVLGTDSSWNGAPPQGQMVFTVTGRQDSAIRAPKLVLKDPASGVNTTYVPIYYANLFLVKALGMQAAWTGTSWMMTPQTHSPVTHQTYDSVSGASSDIELIQRENTYLAFNQNQTVYLGLGITAKVDAGMSHQGLQWQEGRWTVEVLSYSANMGTTELAKDVVAYLHTHMLPAPETAGVIIISSTNWNSAALVPKTTIAWEEGTVVYQLQTMNPPLDALQEVVNSR